MSKYKSIQINLQKDKHKDIISWLEGICEDEERSLNSVIVYILKREYERCQNQKPE